MGKKKTPAVWAVLAQGLGLSLGVYLAGVLLLTLLLVQGMIPEDRVFPGIAVLCLASGLGGGLLTARRTRWGTLPSALISAAIFAAVLAVVGFLCWQGDVHWLGQGGGLLLCALAGGILAGLLAGHRPRKSKRR